MDDRPEWELALELTGDVDRSGDMPSPAEVQVWIGRVRDVLRLPKASDLPWDGLSYTQRLELEHATWLEQLRCRSSSSS